MCPRVVSIREIGAKLGFGVARACLHSTVYVGF